MSLSNASFPMVRRLVHCDWSKHAEKRWMAQANWDGRHYVVSTPTGVGALENFFGRVREGVREGETVLVGFDFPIGLPFAYANQAAITSFKDALLRFGSVGWERFYDLCTARSEINVQRPFYPFRPGGTSPAHLVEALGVRDLLDLLRQCERPYPGRNAASHLFWTLGAKQVGRAAISGWRDLLGPALRNNSGTVAIWPFDGTVSELVRRAPIVVAETYPAEAYAHVGIARTGWSKRVQSDRKKHGATLVGWAKDREVVFDGETEAQLNAGFGPSDDGEDPFDALVGLCSMIDVALHRRASGEPDLASVRTVEGWILGQTTIPA